MTRKVELKYLLKQKLLFFFEANPRSVVNSDEDDYNSYEADDDGDDDDDDDDDDNDDNDNDKINGNNSVNIDDDRKVPASDRKVPASLSDELLSADTIKREINARIISPQDYKGMKKATHIPIEVAAIFDYIISLLPTRYKTGTNKVMAGKRSLSRHQLQFYRKHFPPGHMGFLVPPSNKTQPPDLHYSILEGRRFFFVRWELNIPGIEIKCPECEKGEMIHFRYDFRNHGFVTPIIDLSGNTDYAASMMYDCNNCPFSCKGNNGKLFNQFSYHLRTAYPVDARWASSNEVHMNETATRVIENLIVTNGSGDQLSKLIHWMRAMKFEDLEESYLHKQ